MPGKQSTCGCENAPRKASERTSKLLQRRITVNSVLKNRIVASVMLLLWLLLLVLLALLLIVLLLLAAAIFTTTAPCCLLLLYTHIIL
jgi:type IV secretory pathway TrbL component